MANDGRPEEVLALSGQAISRLEGADAHLFQSSGAVLDLMRKANELGIKGRRIKEVIAYKNTYDDMWRFDFICEGISSVYINAGDAVFEGIALHNAEAGGKVKVKITMEAK